MFDDYSQKEKIIFDYLKILFEMTTTICDLLLLFFWLKYAIFK